MLKRILKKEYTISSGTGKMQPPRHLAELCIWKNGLGVFYIDTITLYKNKMDSKVITSP